MADQDIPRSELPAESGEIRDRLAAAEAATARAQDQRGPPETFEQRHRALAESTGAGMDAAGSATLAATEQALHQGDGRFRSLVRDLQVGVVVVECVAEGTGPQFTAADWCITLVNDAALEILSLPEERLLGLNPFTQEWPAVHEDGSEFPTPEHPLPHSIKTGRPVRDVVMGFRSDAGKLAWVRADAVPHFAADGTVNRTIGTFVDITARRLIETALRDSEARFRAVVETVPTSIWIYDGEGIVFVNEALVGLTGYSREELLRPHFFDGLFERDELATIRERDDARLRGEPTPSGYEIHIRRADGGQRVLEVEPATVAFGGRPAVLACAFDVTSRKDAEKERQRLDLQMQHAQKLESLGILAGGIAHDFNNLLVAILGNAGLALMELPPESPARETVEAIETAAQRAADLTRQMLAYSGKGKFIIEPLSLSRLVEEMGHLLEVSVSRRAVLEYHFAPDMPLVEVDATQVRQVIMNLITNAADAIGDRSGVITVSTGVIEADRAYLSETYLDNDLPEGRYAYIEVSDTGTGMEPETRARLFDPFFTTKFTGRGLGLAAVLGIVRGHRGAIKILSQPGHGTTFRVLFPVGETSFEEGVAAMPQELSQGAPVAEGTILVVDDDETVRAVTRRMLEYSGYHVVLAADGEAAVSAFQAQPDAIRLVLLDMTMPRMDGDETFRQLRRVRPDVHVLLMSGYSEQDAIEQFAGKGIAGFVQKPFRAPDLLARIRDAME